MCNSRKETTDERHEHDFGCVLSVYPFRLVTVRSCWELTVVILNLACSRPSLYCDYDYFDVTGGYVVARGSIDNIINNTLSPP